jgi:predicted nuclease with TOPRIM domain
VVLELKWDFREDMIDIGMRIKSKFTGNVPQDVETLRKAIHDHYDELIKWRESILNNPKASAYHQAARDGIKSIHEEKQRLDDYFKSARSAVESHIDIIRHTT